MRLSCDDLGIDCSFVVIGASAEEVKKKLINHARKDHADMMRKMSENDLSKMTKMMDDMLTSTK